MRGGIAFSGQMMGCVAVDREARPLRNAIIWADQRGVEEANALIEKVGPDFCLHNRRNKPCKLKPGCGGYTYFSTDRWGGIITPFRDEATGYKWLSEIDH